MTTATESSAPFTFNRDYDDHDQVRPYYDAYLVRRAQIESAGQYPYNDSFRGQIDGLKAATERDEDSAIYMLQKLHQINEDDARLAEFLAAGGVSADQIKPGEVWRGDVAEKGFYSGGTGWNVTCNARLSRDSRGYLVMKEFGKRRGFYLRGAVYIQRKGQGA